MRKRLVSGFLALAMLCGSVVSASAAEEPITVIMDGKKVEFSVDPINVDGNVLVQFRPIFERFKMLISWNEEDQIILASNRNWKIELEVGDRYARVNDESVKMDVAVQTVDGNTMVPLRFITESSGQMVEWDSKTNTVTISKGMDVVSNSYHFGGGSYDPKNLSSQFGEPEPEVYNVDEYVYVYWLREDEDEVDVMVSIAEDGEWIVEAVVVTTVDEVKHLPKAEDRILFHEDKVFVRDASGIQEIQVNEKGKAVDDDVYFVKVYRIFDEDIIEKVYSEDGLGFIMGRPGNLKLYLEGDVDDPLDVEDPHQVLSDWGDRQLVYNADREIFQIYEGKDIRQIRIDTGELIYDKIGKDKIVVPVERLVAGPSYHEGKMYYAYQEDGKRVWITSVDADLKNGEPQLTNYYIDTKFLSEPTFTQTGDHLYFWSADDFERRPSLRSVIIEK